MEPVATPDIEALRDEAIALRKAQALSALTSRKRKLQELYAVTRYIEKSASFPSAAIIAKWGFHDAVLDPAERKFLEDNNIEQGRYFDEDTLPTYSLASGSPPPAESQHVEGSSKVLQLRAPTTPPSTIPESDVERTPTPPLEKKRRLGLVQKPSQTSESEGLPSPVSEARPNGVDADQRDDVDKENAPPTPCSSGSSQASLNSNQPPAPPSPDQAAPVTKVDGIPVIKEAATAIPDERERAMGVKPPPPPDLPPKNADTPVKEKSNKVVVNDVEEEEIPDSQPSPAHKPQNPAHGPLALVEARLPALPPQLQQLPPQPPLVISTDCNNRVKTKPPQNPLPVELGDVHAQQDVSSPVSTIDGDNHSTPGPGVISSATSPDPHHLTGERDETGLQAEAALEQRLWKQAVKEQQKPPSLEKTDGEDLPSTVAQEEISAEVEDVAMEIPPITDAEEDDSLPIVTSTARTKPEDKEQSEEPPSSPTSPAVEPISPDPSAQLQLENELAKAVTPLPDPDNIPPLGAEKALELIDQKAKEEASMPAPQQTEEQILDDEEEDEDRVQLVGSTEPASRIPSPQSVGALPKPPIEPPAIQEPSSAAPEPEKEREVVEEEQVTQKQVAEAPAKEPTPAPEPKVDRTEPASTPVEVQSKAEPKPPVIPAETVSKTTVSDEEVAEEPPSTPGIVLPVDEPELDIEMKDASAEPAAMTPPQEHKEGSSTPASGSQAESQKSSEPGNEVEQTSPGPQPAPKVTHAELDRSAPESMELDDMDLQAVSEPSVDKSSISSSSSVLEASSTAPISPPPTAPESASPAPEAASKTTTEGDEVPIASQAAVQKIESSEYQASLHPPRKYHPTTPKLALSKIVVSSARHAAATAEAELKRLREDQEQQGLIVVARRRTQQAATVAARGRSSLFPPGSKMDALTRFQVDDPPPTKEEAVKKVDVFEPYYQIKSLPSTVDDLIKRAPKAVTTDYHNVRHFDHLTMRVLQRVSELQEQGLWSLQQLAKAPEPPRKKAHWDYMLDEMKWLQQDFRGERRWKVGVSKQVADWVMEWHETAPELRLQHGLIVDRKEVGYIPKGIRTGTQPQPMPEADVAADVDMADISHPTPELVAGGATPEDEGGESYFVKQEQIDDVMVTVGEEGDLYKHLEGPPAATVFSLRPQDTVFSFVPTKDAQDVLDQLPLFSPPSPPTPGHMETADISPIILTSKYTIGRIECDDEDPPRKKSRYEYKINRNPYADDSDDEDVVTKTEKERPIPLHPEQNNVALFRPEFKNTLNRVRTGHGFRPPSEMPPASYFEHRTPSLWTPEEDEKLRQLAKEYNHNWGLISTFMVLDGTWHSGAERRSPWECFERWLGFGEFPPEFQKSPYYKPVQQRLELAGKYSAHFVQLHQSGTNVPTLKRKGNVPMRVERRRQTKQFTLFDAMRKLAKKRETSLNKSQQGSRAAQAAAARKAQESASSSGTSSNPSRTPQYFSHLKHEKELKAAEAQKNHLLAMNRLGSQNGGLAHAAAQARIPHTARIPGTPGVPGQPGQPIGHRPPGIPGQQRQYTPQELEHIRRLQFQRQQAAALAAHHPAQPSSSQHLHPNSALGPHQQMHHPHAGQPNIKLPQTTAEVVAFYRQQNPQMPAEQVNAMAQKHIQAYHAQIAQQMAARRPGGRDLASSNSAATGVLIGANGPIGPGSQQMQQQQQQQQQQQAQAQAQAQVQQVQQAQQQPQQQPQQQQPQMAAQPQPQPQPQQAAIGQQPQPQMPQVPQMQAVPGGPGQQ